MAIKLVFFHIASHNVANWSEKSLEGLPVESHKLKLATCHHDVSSPRFVLEQCAFTKIISLLVLLYFNWWFGGVKCFRGHSSAAHYKVEDIALLSLSDDHFSFLKPLFFESIRNFGAFVHIHVFEDFNLLKESIVLLPFSLCCFFYNKIEGCSVKRPELTVGFGYNRCCSWSIEEESQLTKGFTCLVASQINFSILVIL